MQKNTLVLFLLLFIQVAAHAMRPAQWIPGSNWIETPASLDATYFECYETSRSPSDTISCPAGTPQNKYSLLFMRNSRSCNSKFPENFVTYNYCFGPMDNPDQELSYSPNDTPMPAKKSAPTPTQQPIFMPELQKAQAHPKKLEELYPAYLFGKKSRQKQMLQEPSHKDPIKGIGKITEEIQPAEKSRQNHNSSFVYQTNHRKTTSIGAVVDALLTVGLNKNKKLTSNDQLDTEQTGAAPAIEAQNTQQYRSYSPAIPIAMTHKIRTIPSTRQKCLSSDFDKNSDNETASETTKRSPSTDSFIFEME